MAVAAANTVPSDCKTVVINNKIINKL
ncbi:hypothetical protein LSAJ156_440002 [Latilactobacillus sakei]|nr:hypothetical protein LSAJ156_440002 [Latilactobacillus sakei]